MMSLIDHFLFNNFNYHSFVMYRTFPKDFDPSLKMASVFSFDYPEKRKQSWKMMRTILECEDYHLEGGRGAFQTRTILKECDYSSFWSLLCCIVLLLLQVHRHKKTEYSSAPGETQC